MAEHLKTLDKIFSLLESLKTDFKRVSDRQREQDVEIGSLLAAIRVSSDTPFDNNAEKTNTPECCKSRLDTQKSEQAVMDNFINKVRAEMSQMGVAQVKQKTNLVKSHSFSERPTRKKISTRSCVSDPLLKDEKEKHEAFRTVCLSQTIQRHLTDIVENTTAHKRISLPDWLSAEEIKFIQKKRQRRNNNLRKFLMILMRKDFGTMYQWVHNNLDEKLKQMIWETFNEFRDEDLNKTKYRCLRCRMSFVTCVTKVADQLKSVGLLSDELYLNIIDTPLKTGAQETLWNSIFEECKQSQSTQIVNCAFKVAFGSLITSGKETESSEYEAIYCSISSLNGDSDDLLVCQCSDLCSKSLHPVSCVKSFAMSTDPCASFSKSLTGQTRERDHELKDVSNNPKFRQTSKAKSALFQRTLHIPNADPTNTFSDSSISSPSAQSSGSSDVQGNSELSTEEDVKSIPFDTMENVHRKGVERRRSAMIFAHNANHKVPFRQQSLRSESASSQVGRQRPTSAAKYPQTVATTEIINKTDDRKQFFDIQANNVFVQSVVKKYGKIDI